MTDTPPTAPQDEGQGAERPTAPAPGAYASPDATGAPGPQVPYGGAQGAAPLRPEDERLWSTLIHIAGILFGFLPAIIGYFVLRDRGPFIRENTRVALNFQLTMLIGYVAGLILSVIVIGLLVVLAVGVMSIVFSIIAAVAANQGRPYKYPLSIEFFKG